MLKILNKFFHFCGGKNQKKFYLSILLGVFMALFEALKIPAIVLMLDAVIKGRVTTAVIWQCFGICLMSVIGGFIVKYFNTMLQCEAGYDTAAGKRIQIAEHLRYLPMGYFNNNSMGYITSVTTNTMESLGDVATRVVMLTTQGVLTTLLIAVMLLFYDWRIGLTVLAGLLLFFLVNSRMQKKSETISPRKIAADSSLVEKLLDYIQGILEVRSYHLTSSQSRKLNAAIDENEDCNFALEKTFIPYMCLQNFVTRMTGVAMTLLSIWFYLQGSMDLIVCISMMICSFIVYSSLESAGNYSALLRTVDVSVDKASEILELPPMDIEGTDLEPENYDIDVQDIVFSYDKRRIIDGITVHIPERTTTAIVGPSGGGKTTLCHLISRFWDVDAGCVKLGGTDVKEYSMDSLMKNFSFVFQNVYLFQDTVANNIRFGREDAPMEQVIDAAKKACCHDFIMALPDGYDTLIGEGGASLSGGEKQRISIARAMMKDSPVIILDEAFSKMDGERIQESIHLLRRFGLQAIFSAPPDKIPDIAPLVDRNIAVYKDSRHSFTRYFDPKQIEELVEA